MDTTQIRLTLHVKERYAEHHPRATEADLYDAIANSTQLSKESAIMLTGRLVRQKKRNATTDVRIFIRRKQVQRKLKPKWLQQGKKEKDIIDDIYLLTEDKRGIFVLVAPEMVVVCTYLRLLETVSASLQEPSPTEDVHHE